MSWDEIADQYEALGSETNLAARNHATRDLLGKAASAMPRDNPVALEWFVQALRHPKRSLFVARVLTQVSPMPRTLLDPMLLAALLVQDASAPRIWIRPCVRTFGVSVVGKRLAALASEPGVAENDGLKKAIYWLGR